MVTGATSSLSLFLNIEQYEYMKGPHNEAGAQVYICISNVFNNTRRIQGNVLLITVLRRANRNYIIVPFIARWERSVILNHRKT
jgi:hypothetical protein